MNLSRRIPSKSYLTRALSTRASHVLKSVGLPTAGELNGVYDGQWKGSGHITQSVCPTTGELLASVRTASSQDLRAAVEKSREAYKVFRSMVDSSSQDVSPTIYS
jgi:aldehyde dehydrogenase family 7 protein A1